MEVSLFLENRAVFITERNTKQAMHCNVIL
jgi:hypothetical protein